MFCFILTRKELINGFNLLLVGLAAFDSCYIFGAVMESIRYVPTYVNRPLVTQQGVILPKPQGSAKNMLR